MLALVLFPFFLLVLKCMFFWSERANRIINLMFSKLCFNIYIRFVLEAYL